MGKTRDWNKSGDVTKSIKLLRKCVPAALGHFLQNLAQNSGLQSVGPFLLLARSMTICCCSLEHLMNVHESAL